MEEIPDDNGISRLVTFPRAYDAERGLLWNELFQFPTPPDKSAPHESAIWRKYIPSDADVHAEGISREAQKAAPFRYVGFISAKAGEIRRAVSSRGHSFAVEHDPQDAPIYHVKISLKRTDGRPKFSPTEKADMRALLANVFGQLVPRPN